MLKTERAPLNIYSYTGKMGIFWHFGNEAVAPCEREESWDFSKAFIRLSNNTEPPSWKGTTLN